MKSIKELEEIRQRTLNSINMRKDNKNIRIVVGMATCGIAAGARPVLNALVEEISAMGLSDTATVTQTGCIGICQFEPIVEVYQSGKEKVTYVKMTPDKAKRVVEEHIKNGKPVAEFTLKENA